MVRMVDLIKGGGDKEPNHGKKKKSSSPKGGRKSSGSSKEEQPAQLNSSEPEKGTGISFGAAVASAGAAEKSPGAPPAKGRRTVLGGSGGKKSAGGSLRSPTSLDVKSKYCPYLGGRKERKRIIDYPAQSNVCFAEGSREKKLLRTLTMPFSVIPPQRQREFCLAAYNRCPVYLDKHKEETG